MSHMIPPMLSTTPPPLGDPHEEDEDEEDFGDFTSADYSFQIDGDENESPRHVPSVKDPWPPLDGLHSEPVEPVPAEILKDPWPPSEAPVDPVPVSMPANINDSWPPREEPCKESVEPSEVLVNGVQNHDITDEEVEEELKDSSACAPPDNTSQDSVVSANTDSGLCSASDEASPLPPACTESTDLPSQVSSASDATLVWTNHIETPSLESPMSTNCYSLLAENNNDTLSTVPAFSSQSISIVNEEDSQTNCDLILTPQSEEECENGVNSMEDISVSEMSSTLKHEGEGVPLSDLANDFGDHTNATSNISLSSLPTDLSPTETENSSNPLDSSDNFQSIAVNQTNTLQDDTLSFGDFESVSSDACTNNKTDVPELSLDKSKEYDNLENNSSSFDNNDDFGEFESVSNQVMTDLDSNKDNISLLNQESSSVKSLGNDDEFCDFSSAAVTTADDDFGDFEVAPVSEDIVEPWADSTMASDDASTTQASAEGWAEPFTEATSSSTAAVPSSSSTVEAQDDDDEFDDFESAVESSSTITSQPLGPDLVALVTQLFPVPPSVHFEEQIAPPLTAWLPAERGTQPSLWPLLRDVQSTPALDFQWASSSSHKCLLGALGIDSRNIMFGQRWNANMPRFAANLGQSPLEPVRADMMSSSLSVAGSSPAVNEEVQVPAAQFDWTGSGLVNPLDSSHATLLLDLDFLATFDNFASPSAPAAAWRTLAASKQTEEAIRLQKNTVKPPDLTLEPVKSTSDLPLEPVRSPDLALEVKDVVMTPELSVEAKTRRSSELILSASELSTAARHVLVSLPDLSYMRAGQLKPKPLP